MLDLIKPTHFNEGMVVMHKHKAEGVIPQYLLKKLANEGNEKAKESIERTKEILKKRVDKPLKRDTTIASAQPVKDRDPDRYIYDCEHTEKRRKRLARSEGDPASNDDDVNRAYDFSGVCLDYFKNVLNRNSIDNLGMDMVFNVNYGKNFLNAFWDPNRQEMVFGDGDGKTFLSFTRSLDVIAHEKAHGITEYTNNLEYAQQSGALNEHFSDVIGSAVKQHAKGESADRADWLIGNDIVGPKFDGIALRSMKEPGTAFTGDPQPNHMSGYKDLPVNEEGDYGGVHINSGIPNKAFYLVSMEIGTDDAAILWYNAWNNKEYLHSNAQFKDAFEAILKTAQTLTNQGAMPHNTEKSVIKAFGEVGIYSLVSI